MNPAVPVPELPTFKTETDEGDYIIHDFPNGLWIRGRKLSADEYPVPCDEFAISDMYYPDGKEKKLSHKGYGTLALRALKAHYGALSVCEVTDKAIPFWEKMVKRGIVARINSYWEDA